MEPRPGPLWNLPVGEEGSRNPPEVLAVSFVVYWRPLLLLSKELNPVAVGTTNIGISIWHEKSTGSWDCRFADKLGEVRHLAWNLHELTLAYADNQGTINLVAFDTKDSTYKISPLHKGKFGSEVCSLTWCKAGLLAATLSRFGEEKWYCVIYRRHSTGRTFLCQDMVVSGSIARFIPDWIILFIGGPSGIQIYSNPGTSRSLVKLELVESKEIGLVREICVSSIGGQSELEYTLGVLGSSCDVNLYRFFAHGSPERLSHVGIVKELCTHDLPCSMAFNSSTLAVSYSDGTIVIYTKNSQEKYELVQYIPWEDSLKVTGTLCCLAWLQTGGERNMFDLPVLAVGANNGFVIFYEICPATSRQLLPPCLRNREWKKNYYYHKPVSATTPVEVEKTLKEELEVFTASQIFCNMPLNMSDIKAIGFDMDCIAGYAFKDLNQNSSYKALDRLVDNMQYPEEIKNVPLDFKKPLIRGLVIDTKRGNLLKLDRDGRVEIATHGLTRMPQDKQHTVYGTMPPKYCFAETEFAVSDTYFSLGEGYLFANMVEYMDKWVPGKLPPNWRNEKDYETAYKDIKSVFETLHQDGTVKALAIRMPSRFLKIEREIITMIKSFRQRGIKTFLVSHSLSDDTDKIMEHICRPEVGDGKRKWLQLFDVVIIIRGSLNETFFDSEKRQDIFEVDTRSGHLENLLDVKAPLHSTAEEVLVYQGGDIGHLLARLEVNSATELLYISHQIIGGMQCSRKACGWRSMLIIPELKEELGQQVRISRKELIILRKKRGMLEDQIYFLQKIKPKIIIEYISFRFVSATLIVESVH